MFEGQPKGLWALALANTGERFGYYTMLAVFILFLQANFGYTPGVAGGIQATFLMLVYFLPIIGGIAADKFGFGRMVTTGIFIMFLGYALLSVPLGSNWVAVAVMGAALVLVSLGTGLFKGNLQVMVGRLYDEPKYADKRDNGFSLFYMAINIGAMFAPTAAIMIMKWAQTSLGVSEADSYHFAFAVACASLILSIGIYYAFSSTYKHVLASEDKGQKAVAKRVEAEKEAAKQPELTKEQTKERIVCLALVMGVVIFFWMAFHQNGSALTFFAKKYTNLTVSGGLRLGFNIGSLAMIAASVYTLFSVFQSDSKKTRLICGAVTLALWGGAYALYASMSNPIAAQPSDFQQFNPFFVVALTPISMVIFESLAKKGKEPSAPKKIALGMLVAALGFVIITLASFGLTSPKDLAEGQTQSVLSPAWLIGTYFTLTFAELLLSPMGMSFVTKVAPPKYKGMMMGGWFAATALGNYLSMIPSKLWNKIPLMANWGILIGLCLVAAVIMFAMMKKIEAATES